MSQKVDELIDDGIDTDQLIYELLAAAITLASARNRLEIFEDSMSVLREMHRKNDARRVSAEPAETTAEV